MRGKVGAAAPKGSMTSTFTYQEFSSPPYICLFNLVPEPQKLAPEPQNLAPIDFLPLSCLSDILSPSLPLPHS